MAERPSDIYLVVNLRLSHASPPLQPLQQGQQVDIVVVKDRIHHISALFHSDARGLDPTLEAAIFAEVGVDTAVYRRLDRGAAGASVEFLFFLSRNQEGDQYLISIGYHVW